MKPARDYNRLVDGILQFITSNAGILSSAIGGAIVIVAVIAAIDRHPRPKPQEKPHPEPERDDE